MNEYTLTTKRNIDHARVAIRMGIDASVEHAKLANRQDASAALEAIRRKVDPEIKRHAMQYRLRVAYRCGALK